MTARNHQTVLREEAVAALVTRSDGCYVDATFGRGGHTLELLQRLDASAQVLVVDKDPEAIAVANALAREDARVRVAQGSFAAVPQLLREAGLPGMLSGVLLDLGVSSPQLDDPVRGFSFRHDGALDMRMDPARGETAAQWLGRVEERELVSVLRLYGEERFARRIARAILAARAEAPIDGTGRLAEVIAAAHPAWEPGRHPATRSFQAIRIHINRELEELELALPLLTDLLETGGRLVVISFHSLEDRLVKRFIRDRSRGDPNLARLPLREDQISRTLRAVGKSVRPGAGEIAGNPRARSAIMRVAERLAG